MTSFTKEPLASLLSELFVEEVGDKVKGRLSKDEGHQLLNDKNAPKELWGKLKDAPLQISRRTGELLYMLARHSKARHIVEFGTSFGVSTLCLAAALKDNGGGKLITTELEASKLAIARENIKKAGLEEFVEIREGDALKTLAENLPEIDIFLLDGAIPLYLDVLKLVKPHLRPSALIIGDNANLSPDYLEYVRNEPYFSLPFADGVELSILP